MSADRDAAPLPRNDTAHHVQVALDGRWREVREQVRRDFDPAKFGPPPSPLPMEEHRARVKEQLLALTTEPFARMGLSPAQGGTGDHGASVTGFEMLGHADLSLFVKAGVQFGLFGGAIANLGTESHHTAYLPKMLDGSLLGAFAMTETGRGSDVQSLHTTATYDPQTDELIVDTPDPSARKDYIGNAARDGILAAVFAQLIVDGVSHGVHCVLVPIRDEDGAAMPGVTIGDCGAKMGLPGVDNGRLSFDHVRVPRASLLDRYGAITDEGSYTSPIESDARRFFTMLGTLVRGRVSVGAGAGAATRNALTIAVRYAAQRTQFTRPDSGAEVVLLDYRAHQRRLLIPLARTYAIAFAQNALVELMHTLHSQDAPDEHSVRQLEGLAAAMKVAGTAHATATIQVCREACGGAGYLWGNRFAQLKADTDVFTTFEGDNTVLLQLVAKGLLTDYRDSFDSLDTRAMVLFGAKQFAGSVIERAVGGSVIARLIAGAPGRDADNALTDRGGQIEIFSDRESHAVEGVAMRMRRSSKEADADLFEVFNNVQDHMLVAARAHIDRVLLEAFATAIDAVEDPEAAALLGTVCDLFVYSTVEANAAWFLEHGRISASQSKAVTARVNQLVAELAPHALLLVDAFGIPDGFVTAEMLQPAESSA